MTGIATSLIYVCRVSKLRANYACIFGTASQPTAMVHRRSRIFDHCSNALDSTAEINGLLVHCGAGMSRSPAIAVLALCYLQPSANPLKQMVNVENSSTCEYIWPNPLVVQLGDRIMQRNGDVVHGVNCWRRLKEPGTAEY